LDVTCVENAAVIDLHHDQHHHGGKIFSKRAEVCGGFVWPRPLAFSNFE
jgi:hypothetical protein